jgi:hypothetical protein
MLNTTVFTKVEIAKLEDESKETELMPTALGLATAALVTYWLCILAAHHSKFVQRLSRTHGKSLHNVACDHDAVGEAGFGVWRKRGKPVALVVSARLRCAKMRLREC